MQSRLGADMRRAGVWHGLRRVSVAGRGRRSVRQLCSSVASAAWSVQACFPGLMARASQTPLGDFGHGASGHMAEGLRVQV